MDLQSTQCKHERRFGNSEGETCTLCGTVTAGYGAFRPYAKECKHVVWGEKDQPMALCSYCMAWLPNPYYQPQPSLN